MRNPKSILQAEPIELSISKRGKKVLRLNYIFDFDIAFDKAVINRKNWSADMKTVVKKEVYDKLDKILAKYIDNHYAFKNQ